MELDEVDDVEGLTLNPSEAVQPYIRVHRDQRTAWYTGKGNHAEDFGTVRTQRPLMARSDGVSFFEVEIVDGGLSSLITVGVSPRDFNLRKQVGSVPHSIGYAGDDGHLYVGSGAGKRFGPHFSSGDVVGCGFNAFTREMFFTIGARMVGVAAGGVNGDVLFPTVSLHSPGEKVRFRFEPPFTFDVGALRASERARVESQIAGQTTDHAQLLPLVRDYLARTGYAATLNALGTAPEEDSKDEKTADVVQSSLAGRGQVFQAVCAGDAARAMAALEHHFPEVLATRPQLAHRVHLLAVVEFARADKRLEALAYAQKYLTPVQPGMSDAQKREQADVMSLLAYKSAAATPPNLHVYFDAHVRRGFAKAINHDILTALAPTEVEPARTSLSLLLDHLRCTQRQLVRDGQQAIVDMNVLEYK